MDSEKSTVAPDRPAISFPPNAVHLVRTNQQITMQLSQMADQKAVVRAGADVLVAGTATFKGGPDAYADNIRRLRG